MRMGLAVIIIGVVLMSLGMMLLDHTHGPGQVILAILLICTGIGAMSVGAAIIKLGRWPQS